MKFRVSRRANVDLDEIWNFIAQDSVGAADKVEAKLHEAMKMLARRPGLGHARSDVRSLEYRFWRVYSYLIAYRVRGKTLIIVRVLHGSRDLRRFPGSR